MHPRDLATTAYTFPHPGLLNNALTVGDAVNGGASTFIDPWDRDYVFALTKRLVDFGYFRTGGYSQQIRWLASKPGRPGLMVHGFNDPHNAAVAIGDTVGVLPMNILQGSGSNGALLAYPMNPAGSRFLRSSLFGDLDWDGKDSRYGVGDTSWSDSIDPDERWYLAAGQGDVPDSDPGVGGNNALMMWDDSGLNVDINIEFDTLPAGNYCLVVNVQSVQILGIALGSEPSVWMCGISETNRVGQTYGLPDYELVCLKESILQVDADQFFPVEAVRLATGTSNDKLGTTNFGNDAWPGGEPTVRDEAAWYSYVLSFNVPDFPRSSNFDALLNPSHGRVTGWMGYFKTRLQMFSEDVTGGPGLEEHSRLGSVQLYWMGGN
jgi:hypothetical protein